MQREAPSGLPPGELEVGSGGELTEAAGRTGARPAFTECLPQRLPGPLRDQRESLAGTPGAASAPAAISRRGWAGPKAGKYDGARFTVDPAPAVAPLDAFEEYGLEDPRATLIDGVWHITYVSAGRLGITTSRLTTTDFRASSGMA